MPKETQIYIILLTYVFWLRSFVDQLHYTCSKTVGLKQVTSNSTGIQFNIDYWIMNIQYSVVIQWLCDTSYCRLLVTILEYKLYNSMYCIMYMALCNYALVWKFFSIDCSYLSKKVWQNFSWFVQVLNIKISWIGWFCKRTA